MEPGTIERDLYVDASPQVVYDVASRPEHVQDRWPDRATDEPVAGSVGEIAFGGPAVSA